MKNLKKIICLLLIILIYNVSFVKADECDNVSITGNMGRYTGSFAGNGVPTYTFSGSNSTTYEAFCHDPDVDSGIRGSGKQMSCIRSILDPSTVNSSQNAFDEGLAKILKNSASYSTRYIAINIYQLFWPMKDTTRANNNKAAKEFRYWANYLKNNDSEVKSLLADLKKALGGSNILSKDLSNTKNPTDSSISSARALVVEALKAALDYSKEGGTTIALGNPTRNRKETEENGSKIYTQTFTYKLKIDNFKSESASVKINFSCSNCSSRGVNVKLFLRGEEISQADLANKNLVEFLEDGSGEIEYKIEFSADSKNYLCEDIDFTTKVKYYDDALNIRAFEVSTKPFHNTDVQTFYVVATDNNKVERELSVDNRISLCNASCKDLKNLCEQGNSKACSRFNSEYNGECVFCTSNVPYVECTTCNEDRNVFDIVEGYDIDPSSCEEPTDDKLNIKKCIANDTAVDSSGNKYKSNNLSSVSSYANVYCKEDYKMDMPGSIKVDAGRYFVLMSKIEGIKYCYTNEITGESTLRSRILSAARESMDAYERYQDLLSKKEAVDAGRTRSRNTPGLYLGHTSSVCRTTSYFSTAFYNSCITYQCSHAPEGQSCTEYCNSESWMTRRYYNFTPYVDLIYYDIDCSWGQAGSCPAGKHINSERLLTGEPSDCERYFEDYEHVLQDVGEDYGSYLLGQIGSRYTITGKTPGIGKDGGGITYRYTTATGATGDLYVGVSAIRSAITEWNKATGRIYGSYSGSGGWGDLINPQAFDEGWEMNYNFKPEMYFWYQEKYMDNALTDKLETMGNINIESNPKYQFCTGSVSDDYKDCSTGWETSMRSGVNYKTENVWACDLDGCRWFSYIQSTVKYTKSNLKADATFITPTQYYTIYPEGSIVTAKEGTEVENGTALEHGLPVGLGTPNGERTYLLWFEKLGEYFNSDELGRVWGNNASVISTNLKEGNACFGDNSALVYEKEIDEQYFDGGLYACKYDINICDRTDDCKEESDNYCDPDCPEDPDCSCKEDSDDICNPNCPGDPDCNNNYNCQKPYIDQSGKYTYKNNLGIGRNKVDEATYNVDCCPAGICPDPVCIEDNYCNPKCPNDPDCNNSYNCENPYINNSGKYTYIDNYGVRKTNVDKSVYDTDCCPECLPTVRNECSVIEVNGELQYYGKNAQRVYSESAYKAQCCPEGRCNATCTNCLYDGVELLVDYRQVTNENVNPNNRTLGKNWRWDDNIDTAIELKAAVTTYEIEEEGDLIFDVDFDNPQDSDEFAMKVTMDSQMISWIRQYNKEAGTYLNNTLSCYDYNDTEKNKVYKNIYCYSKFLDEVIADHTDDGKVIVAGPRRPENDAEREKTDESKYFTNWSDVEIKSTWDIQTTKSIDYYTQNFGAVYDYNSGKMTDYHVGPSWK